MAYWHYPDGEPAPWGKGGFDWSHLIPSLIMATAIALALLKVCLWSR